jgi:hypothetical protein
MAVLAKLLSALSIPLTLLALVGMIWQVNKERRLNVWSPIMGLVMAPAILIFNLLVLRQAHPACIGPVFGMVGLGLGLAWGLTTRLTAREGGVIGRQSVLHLLFWGLSVMMTQALILLAPAEWVKGGLVLMYFSAGATIGTNLNLFLRWVYVNYQSAHRNAPVRTARSMRPAPPPPEIPARSHRQK